MFFRKLTLHYHPSLYPTRISIRSLFDLPNGLLNVLCGNFWLRTTRLCNNIHSHVKVGCHWLETTLFTLFWKFFDWFYDVERLCTWTYACTCHAGRKTHSIWVYFKGSLPAGNHEVVIMITIINWGMWRDLWTQGEIVWKVRGRLMWVRGSVGWTCEGIGEG